MKNLLSKCLLCLGLIMMPIVSWADEEYDTDRGFRHPGGLHTEADFVRIRQQLSEGNEKVVAAYNKLKSAAYSQSSAATYPVETIVRGGGVGENYINAARGATIAYQNALRWKIDGSEANARHAVIVLNQWARTTKAIYDRSAAYPYNFDFQNYGEAKRGNNFKVNKKGGRISLDNKCNLQIAYDGKHYDLMYQSIELADSQSGLLSLISKSNECILITIDKDNKILLYEGSARVECKKIGKKVMFLGASGKDYRAIVEQLRIGTFRM